MCSERQNSWDGAVFNSRFSSEQFSNLQLRCARVHGGAAALAPHEQVAALGPVRLDAHRRAEGGR
eukprot:3805373-Prymnesium_polylepis.1